MAKKLVGRKFHDEVWRMMPTEKHREQFRKKKRTMKELARSISEILTPEFCKKYYFGGRMPLGMGLNAFVYPSSLKNVVIKMLIVSKGKRNPEIDSALRLKKLGLNCVVKVYEVVMNVLDTGEKDIHLIYIEQLQKPKDKVSRALEDLLHPVYIKNQGTPRPKELIEHVIEMVTKAPKGSTIRAVAKQLVGVFKELMRHKEWHLDLHADNVMVNNEGQLKLVDLGGFDDVPVLAPK